MSRPRRRSLYRSPSMRLRAVRPTRTAALACGTWSPADRVSGAHSGASARRWLNVTHTRIAVLILAGCGLLLSPRTDAATGPQEASAKAAQPLAADTPSTTVAGHTFIAPAGWSVTVKGKATIVEAPEGDSRIVFVDVAAMEPDAAIQEAWAAYRPDAKWPLKAKTASSDKDGWTHQQTYCYQTSPNERRSVAAGTARHGDQQLVWIYDMSDPVAEKRGAQVALIFGRLFPKGYTRETFAGRKANSLDAARIAELGAFVERGQSQLGVPGVSIGDRAGRQGGVRRRLRRAGAREAGEARRGHALHDRVEHEGDDDDAAREARRPEEAHVDDAGHEAPAAVQARGRRHHEQGAGRAPDLRVHGPAAPGLRVAARVRARRRPRARSRRSGRCSRPASSARCSSTRTRWRRPPATSPGTCSSPTGAGRGLRPGDGGGGLRPARDDAHDLRLRAGARRQSRLVARARHRRQARARGDGRQLLDRAGAAGGRRLEQRHGRDEVRADGARQGRAARRHALRVRGGAEGSGASRRCGSARTTGTAWGCRSTRPTARRSCTTAAA